MRGSARVGLQDVRRVEPFASSARMLAGDLCKCGGELDDRRAQRAVLPSPARPGDRRKFV
jgi:hypothetical protein